MIICYYFVEFSSLRCFMSQVNEARAHTHPGTGATHYLSPRLFLPCPEVWSLKRKFLPIAFHGPGMWSTCPGPLLATSPPECWSPDLWGSPISCPEAQQVIPFRYLLNLTWRASLKSVTPPCRQLHHICSLGLNIISLSQLRKGSHTYPIKRLSIQYTKKYL